MASYAVILVADDGEQTVMVSLNDGLVAFDPTDAHAEFPVAKINYTLEFLREISAE